MNGRYMGSFGYPLYRQYIGNQANLDITRTLLSMGYPYRIGDIPEQWEIYRKQ